MAGGYCSRNRVPGRPRRPQPTPRFSLIADALGACWTSMSARLFEVVEIDQSHAWYARGGRLYRPRPSGGHPAVELDSVASCEQHARDRAAWLRARSRRPGPVVRARQAMRCGG